MKDFRCFDCGKIFKAEGHVVEYQDAIYGPCRKTVESCPACGGEATEYVVNNSRSKKREEMAPCGNYRSCSSCGG